MWGSVAFGLVFPLQADSNSNGAHSQTSFFLGPRSLYKGSSFIFQSGKVCGAQADGTAFPDVPHKGTARSGRAGTLTASTLVPKRVATVSTDRVRGSCFCTGTMSKAQTALTASWGEGWGH